MSINGCARMGIKMKTKKRLIIISLFMLFALLVVTLSFLYNKYIDKENNLVLLKKENKQQSIYILGTIHEYHFKKILGYSYLDIQNVIGNIEPELILMEVDQDVFDKLGVIKSPIEMVPLWCYAVEKGIPVKGVDWFKFSEDSRSWTTDKERDDNIFTNILKSIGDESNVLIIVGSAHRIEQRKRFENLGYRQQNIEDKKNLFRNNEKSTFTYPKNTIVEIEKQIDYWENEALNRMYAQTTKNSNGQKYWIKHYKRLVSMIEKLLEKVFITDEMFY